VVDACPKGGTHFDPLERGWERCKVARTAGVDR
jgi:hypothetical protein